MSAAFSTQLTFDWANDHVAATPAVVPSARSQSPTSAEPKLIRQAKTTGNSVNLGVPVTAKPMDELLATRRPFQNTPRRNKTEHISDLLLVVLDRYGISPDDFLATLHD